MMAGSVNDAKMTLPSHILDGVNFLFRLSVFPVTPEVYAAASPAPKRNVFICKGDFLWNDEKVTGNCWWQERKVDGLGLCYLVE